MKPWQRLVLALSALSVSGLVLTGVAYMDPIAEAVFGESNMVMYWSPTEMMDNADRAKRATIRLGGMVKAGDDPDWDKKLPLRFFITDMNQTIPIASTGAPPQMFREGIGVIVEGRLRDDGVFHTGRVLVKHSNEYRVPEEGDDMSDVIKTLEDAT
jgi:cytochrome c-type biogenesis protein CcmE